MFLHEDIRQPEHNFCRLTTDNVEERVYVKVLEQMGIDIKEVE